MGSDPLDWRRNLAARLAVPVALGYTLLLPLLASAALQQQAGQSGQQLARISRATSPSWRPCALPCNPPTAPRIWASGLLCCRGRNWNRQIKASACPIYAAA